MKPGRNEPCSCGSGQKFKHCCGRLEAAPVAGLAAAELGTAEDLLNNGRRLLGSRRPRLAADSFRAAISRQPNDLAAYLGLATAQRILGLISDAESTCEQALTLDPRSPGALVLRGELHTDRGQFEQAHELFERVRTVNPRYAPAYTSIAFHRRMQRADVSWFDGAQSLLKETLSLSDEVGLRYALGKYFDDVGAYDDAFDSYDRANELNKRRAGKYDEAYLTSHVARIIDQCDGSPMAGASDAEEPVFIIGMPRSGTSLAEQILASHPAASGAGEVIFWERAFELVSQGARVNLAQDYLHRLHARAPSALRITDKMPANFFYVGLIHSVFPRARIIHMQRHPLDTCLSIYFQSFFDPTPYANDLSSLAHYYQQYQRIMAHWRRVLPSHVLLEVPYEGLVQDPELWTRRMLEFIGLPWDPACLQFHRSDRAVITASRWQVRQKINAGSVGRWRNYAKHLAPLRSLAPEDLQ
ncbi:MAG: sulfotransferase [Proteobacteria bacterium]|nr:sulfotransferase [Pseudomonadota bacterium]